MRILLIVFTVMFFFSCTDKEKRQSLLPNVTGKARELVVILNQERQDGKMGQAFDSVFAQFQIGLPQDEPLFDLIMIPPSAFQNVFERHRNILNVSIKPAHKASELLMKEDEWAHPQTYVSLQARTEDAMLQLIDSVQDNLLKLFLSVDRKRTKDHYEKFRNHTISTKIKKQFGFDMIVPKGYNIDMVDSAFMWMSHETKNLSQGIIIYSQDYTDEQLLTPEGIINFRDTLFMHKVSGPREGSYMQTEKRMYEPFAYARNLFDDQYTVEMRGLWRVENDFMGGPFLSYTIHDAKNERLITLYGYVYAPKMKKRNYVHQLESILRTFAFAEQNIDPK